MNNCSYNLISSPKDLLGFKEQYLLKVNKKKKNKDIYNLSLDYLKSSQVFAYKNKKNELLGGIIIHKNENFRWLKALSPQERNQILFLNDNTLDNMFETACLWKSEKVHTNIDTWTEPR